MKVQKILVILIFKVSLISGTWSPPYIESLHPNVQVNYQNQTSNSIDISITMNEEIPTPIPIALLNRASGTLPMITNFPTGSNSLLGISFIQNDTNMEVILNRQQDFENPEMRNYVFTLSAINGITSTFYVRVLNIFDNSPRIKQQSSPCFVDEYNSPGFDSGCIFEVHDDDGMANNSITLTVETSYQYLFEFREVSESMTQYTINYTLIVKESLDYMYNSMHIFDGTVSDIANNLTPLNVVLRVVNVPSRPPVWTQPFASARFNEKEAQQFQVTAIDGDRGIDAQIFYALEFESGFNYNEIIRINETSGVIDVAAIDRDAWQREIFSFTIKAVKSNNLTNTISSSAVLIVDDINDNAPIINFNDDKSVIQIWEAEFDTLFNSTELSVNDIDLGDHATYSISILPAEFAEALNIIPINGYQLQNFTISVANTELLDYEDDLWRAFNITIYTEEMYTSERLNDSKEFRVELKNWNDELPIFEESSYNFTVLETISRDKIFGVIKANDRDIDDSIIYSLTGSILSSFSINSTSGEIKTLINDAFDYEQQTEIYFQAFASDTLKTEKNETLHTTFTQIRIIVEDVNDTPPQLILPQGVLKVLENDINWNYTITAIDPDTTADLELFIVWDQSSVSGPDTNESNYRESLIIEPDPGTDINRITGTLKVNPAFTAQNKSIDYEKFHFMYIMIGVVDKNTTINENVTYALITIEIEDENDNPPEFVGDTLTISRRVVEEAKFGIFIGTIRAEDKDGPGNNDITFSMVPKNSTEGIDNWLRIDPKSGEISVNSSDISCDKPNEKFTLDYIVIITDGVWTESGDISIEIIDINNKVPQIDNYTSSVSLYEDASDEMITNILAHDDDRDALHNVLYYSIKPNLAADFFIINSTTGELRVRELLPEDRMDRDNGITFHLISIIVFDNNGTGLPLQAETTVNLTLLDRNDNAPQMPEALDNLPISENFLENFVVVRNFFAPDKDDGVNAQVDYSITSIEFEKYYGDIEPIGYENLFTINNKDNYTAEIKTGMNLRGFSGVWNIEISARDRGELGDDEFSQNTSKIYQITIEPFNFDSPRIIYPQNDEVIRADIDQTIVGFPIKSLDGTEITPLQAIDNDVGIFGEVTFKIESSNGDDEYFGVQKLNKSHSNLIITQIIEERTYMISITGIDGGNRSSDSIPMRIFFVNRTSNPIFDVQEFETDFTENEKGMEEVRVIPNAIDPKLYEIYYYIDQSFNPSDAMLFKLDKEKRELSLTEPLDRENIDHHQIKIIASNFKNPPNQFSEKSTLIVNIKVNDVNDNPPKFVDVPYEVGISEKDYIGKPIFYFNATDPDLEDYLRLTFFIVKDSLEVSNEHLEPYKDNPFELNSITGILTLNFQVHDDISGYFTFRVEVRDLANHTDEITMKVEVIPESNRFSFYFLNTTAEVSGVDQVKLISILSDRYAANCIKNDILPFENEGGTANDTAAILKVHFTKDNDIVGADYITRKGSDPYFLDTLVRELRFELKLELDRIPRNTEIDVQKAETLVISLSVICGVLGALLIGGICFHIFKMKIYNRQIKSLSQTPFDPNALNAKKVPNTNVYANEKSNPALAKDNFGKDFDTKSNISQESDDFADLDNNPIFEINSKVENDLKNPLSQNGHLETPRKESSTFA